MKKVKLQSLALAALLALSINSAAEQTALTLTVLVEGASANKGQAIATLFSSKENYLKSPISEKIIAIDDAGRAQLTFKNLSAGTYAVGIVYDENGDGELNTGFFGIPSEPFGFSNNAKGRFGPPGFKKTSFSFPETDSISITLKRIK